MSSDELLAYFGHHKCATQWLKSVVGDLCSIVGREQVVYNDARGFDRDLAAALPDPGGTFLSYVGADARYLSGLGPMRGFHVIRDPRDIVVSAYFSHRYSHPLYNDLAEYREVLNDVSESEGLLLEMDRRQPQFKLMSEWDYDRPDILELRMEELTTDPATYVPQILTFLGLGATEGVTPRAVRKILKQRDFSKLAGRKRGDEDVTSHYRKGIAGDWVNHFGPEHAAAFQDKFPDLLVRLGYETSADWG